MATHDTPTPSESSSEPGVHDAVEEQFSEYYEGTLDERAKADVDSHLESCPACREAYAEFTRALAALADMHKMSAPNSFDRDVEDSIRRRSAGRFFGRRAFGDRVPFELLAVVILLLGLIIFALIRSSQTGSLRYESPPPTPEIAPNARDVVPQPPR